MNNNIKTMKFICKDNFGNYVYKCVETDILYKDVKPENNKPQLFSCGNEIDGDIGFPIEMDNIKFIDRVVLNKSDQFNYMMLGRLESDCKYYLGYGNRHVKHLWANSEKEQIEEMKRIYNNFPDSKKPEWITWDDILNYEKEMLK